MSAFAVTFAKERQKFSAAHFTIFPDGQVERLHGHNFAVTASFRGARLEGGLLFPFHLVKPLVAELCQAWDERVLLPAQAAWVQVSERGEQCEVHLKTPRCDRFYSFPREDVRLLPCDNISSENLALLFAQLLVTKLRAAVTGPESVDVAISESPGQMASATVAI